MPEPLSFRPAAAASDGWDPQTHLWAMGCQLRVACQQPLLGEQQIIVAV